MMTLLMENNCSILYKTTKEAFYKFLKENPGYTELPSRTVHSSVYMKEGIIIAYMASSSYGAHTVYATIKGDINYDTTNFITNLIDR